MAKKKVRDLTRKDPKREPYSMILIVCEGSKTEVNYFNDLKAVEKLSSVNISVLASNGSDPVSVVRTALHQQERQKNYLPYDEIYCVIDRDEHTNFDEAIDYAKANQIKLIKSYPSFEYWYLCHFICSRAPMLRTASKSAGGQCVALLNQYWQQTFSGTYQKNIPQIYSKLLPKLPTAIAYATRSLAAAKQDGEPNPSTQVHELVQRLRILRNPTA